MNTERVPILIEITEEDRQKAGIFSDSSGCLVATALKRNGYNHARGVPLADIRMMQVDGAHYWCDDINAAKLHYSESSEPLYSPEVVGKQIILYPAERVQGSGVKNWQTCALSLRKPESCETETLPKDLKMEQFD